jgi:predicted esterase YcpF (UPF0227 family)
MTIYYIHGFGSSINSSTLKSLQEHFPDAIGLTYDYEDPEESIKILADQLNSDPTDKIIIGSSLGGWYAEQLTNYVVADYILYNPQLQPWWGLAKYGVSSFVTQRYRGHKLPCTRSVPRTVFLCTDDETIDYKYAFNKYIRKSAVILTSGGHRMTPNNMVDIVAEINLMQGKLND